MSAGLMSYFPLSKSAAFSFPSLIHRRDRGFRFTCALASLFECHGLSS